MSDSPAGNHIRGRRWEERVLELEQKRAGFRGWLRNPVRKDWSLGIPCTRAGRSATCIQTSSLWIGLSRGVVVDVVEPHAQNQADLCPKLLGLCKYADRHGDRLGSIELVVGEGKAGHEVLMAIDVNNAEVRSKAKVLTHNGHIVALARELDRDG